MDAGFLSLLKDDETVKSLFLSDRTRLESVKCNISRFLAAYYLDFSLVYCSSENHDKLPNLFEWSQKSSQDLLDDGYTLIDRNSVATHLSPTFSPKCVIFLLIRAGLVLEAVFCCDYFNDLRTRLLVRQYADIVYKTKLFQDCCYDSVNNLFDTISRTDLSARNLQNLSTAIPQQMDSIIQLSVVFDSSLLLQLQSRIIKEIELIFYSLREDIPLDVTLPRPPIYALPAQYTDVYTNNEIVAWNKLYFLIHSYIVFLQKTNRLNAIAKMVSAAFKTSENDEESFEQVDEDIEESFELFFSIILLVLRMSYRDTLSIAQREAWGGLEYINESYSGLFPLNMDESTKDICLRFIKEGSPADGEHVSMFMNFIQANFSQTNAYLPVLSAQTITEWRHYYLSSCNMKSERPNGNLTDWILPDLITMDVDHAKSMNYLSDKWTSTNLADPTLVQICLRIDAHELFQADQATIYQQISVNIDMLPSPIARPPMSSASSKSSVDEEINLDKYKQQVKEGRLFVRNLIAKPMTSTRFQQKFIRSNGSTYWTSINQKNLKTKQQPEGSKTRVTERENQGAKELRKGEETVDFNELLRKDLLDINERLKKLRGISVFPEEQQTETAPEKKKKQSKRHKTESKARQTRDKMRESQRSSTTTFDSDSVVAVEEPHGSNSRRDYLYDTTVFPEPSLPEFDRLDLSQLSPPVEKRETRTWNEIEVFTPDKSESKFVIADNIPSLEIDSSSNSFTNQYPVREIEEKCSSYRSEPDRVSMRNVPIADVEYPQWLKLLPPKDDDSGRPSTGTGRLLDLDLACRSNRSVKYGEKPLNSHDSGFMEGRLTSSVTREPQNKADSLGFSCNMTAAQINDLMGVCN